MSKITRKGCSGAPDWIIEILSKGTAKKDITEKFEVYQNAGVKEYWIVHPDEETVLTYFLDEEGNYQLIRKTPFVKGEKVPVSVFENFEIDLGEVFL